MGNPDEPVRAGTAAAAASGTARGQRRRRVRRTEPVTGELGPITEQLRKLAADIDAVQRDGPTALPAAAATAQELADSLADLAADNSVSDVRR